MRPRQTIARQWLIVTSEKGADLQKMVRRAPRGTGVLLLQPDPRAIRTLRRLGRRHDLTIASEGRDAARVHDSRELRQAMLRRTPLILLSPLWPTSTHPDWAPMPRMRGAALARLGRRRLLALGGMNRKRYAAVAPLGFIGWAGISAFRT